LSETVGQVLNVYFFHTVIGGTLIGAGFIRGNLRKKSACRQGVATLESEVLVNRAIPIGVVTCRTDETKQKPGRSIWSTKRFKI